MIEMNLEEAAAVLGATLHAGGDGARRFLGVTTDSRQPCEGKLFFAITGPSFDAHDYVGDVARAGGAAAVTARVVADAGLPLLVAEEPRRALVQLATDWRRRFAEVPIVAVTGSNGKTTVKEMLASIFSRAHPTVSTKGNLNTDIGVSLTLCELDATHQRIVIEMGANHPGEIAELARMCAPRVGIVTQCAPAHLEGFGSVEGVARAKGEMFEGLAANGTGVVNADDAFAPQWETMLGDRARLRFGLESPQAEVTGTFTPMESGGSLVALSTPAGACEVRLPLPGRHNVMNALAATAAALALGETLDTIRDGLEHIRPVPGRLCERVRADGAVVLDDTYNANPTSLRAALDVLVARPGERWLVLGDMAELGDEERALHRDAGRLARECGIDRLYGVGPLAAEAVAEFGAGGRHHESRGELVAELRAELGAARKGGAHAAPVTALVKGSRSMAMESVVQELVD